MEKNRKVFILFPDTWLSYSPSIINLAKVMIDSGLQVTLVSFHDGSYHKTEEIEVSYVVPSRTMRKFVGVLRLFSVYRFFAMSYRVFQLRNEGFDLVIGVDSLGYLITRLFFSRPIYFSLHIRRTISALLCKKLKIDRMIIQTPERLKLNFRDCAYKPNDVWYIQNSPIFDRNRQPRVRCESSRFRVVYFGNISKNHYGIENCIELMDHVPDDVTLTLKGPVTPEYQSELEAIYHRFVVSGRLFFDSVYIPQDEVIPWLEGFDLGLCFYDQGEILRNDPNIISAPSGKMFNYLAAGLPTIGSKLSGLRTISDFGAGILLDGQDPKAIGEAAMQIRFEYHKFTRGCKQAAIENDFRVMAERFLSDFENLKVK